MKQIGNVWRETLERSHVRVSAEAHFWECLENKIVENVNDLETAEEILFSLNKDSTYIIIEMMIRIWALKLDHDPEKSFQRLFLKHNRLVEQTTPKASEHSIRLAPEKKISEAQGKRYIEAILEFQRDTLCVPRPLLLNMIWLYSRNAADEQIEYMRTAKLIKVKKDYCLNSNLAIVVSSGDLEFFYSQYLKILEDGFQKSQNVATSGLSETFGP